uniref:Uncharacterized protein n=1 Tax=Zea mays TaxID=4577 RepID=B6U489_MAIZE|nr:hypothetical protein [Zea mays]
MEDTPSLSSRASAATASSHRTPLTPHLPIRAVFLQVRCWPYRRRHPRSRRVCVPSPRVFDRFRLHCTKDKKNG